MAWGAGYRQPPGWRATVRRILERDERRCYLCSGEAVTADHVVNQAAGGGHDDGNLAAICSPCHDAKTQTEANAGRRAKGRRRDPEEHPNPRVGR